MSKMFKDFKIDLESTNLGGVSASNLPSHIWETLGECIDDLEK